MIGHNQHVAVQRIKLDELVIGESLARNMVKISELVTLLVVNPHADLEPMLVKPHPRGYEIDNGHHRFCAYIIAGRSSALCMVVR